MYTKNKTIVAFIILLFTTSPALAQCAMCRAVLESEESGVTAEAVNDGIVYLMAFPYILVALVGFVAYRIMNGNKKEKKEAE
jgi:hypothetical protein